MTRPPAPVADRRGATFGLLSAVGAYSIWGLAALYWPLLEPAGALEILAHRVIWTLLVCAVLLPMVRGWPEFVRVARTPRLLGLMTMATVLISINWGTFIWAVTNGEVLQTSLGYFISPMISVLIGVVVLREQLLSKQWMAVGVGTLAMVLLIVGFGGLPIVAATLAFSFSGYGFIKKRADIDAIPSLAWESLLAAPVALGFLGWLWFAGTTTFGHGAWHTALLLGAGIITAVPLLLFGAAAIRIPLSTMGILQYIGPLLQFCVALWVFGEAMSTTRWIGFILIWIALVLFSYDLVADGSRRYRFRPRKLPDEVEWPT